MKKKPLIDKDGEVRELTAADIRKMRPARDVIPQVVKAYERKKLRARGRPKGSNKTAVSLRLDNDVLAYFKAKGQGWQTRIGDALKAIVQATR